MTDDSRRELRARLLAERQRIMAAPRELRAQLARELRDTERDIRREAREAKRSGRAPAMSVEDRREAILHVALPLLVEREGKVTTGEIAAAAGIAEGTLFRAFGDKRGLLIACYQAALESDREVARIRAIDVSLPLAERLLLATAAVVDFQKLMWGVVLALRAAGIDPASASPECKPGEPPEPPKAIAQIIDAMAELMVGDDLRTNANLAARLLLGLVFSSQARSGQFATNPTEMPEIVDIFLHGAIHTRGGKESE